MNQQQTDNPGTMSEIDRFGAWTERVLWPAGGQGGLRAARRVTGVVTVVGSLIQIVIWLLISVFSRHLDTPWWLFYTVGGAVVAGCLWIVDESGITGSSEGNDL